MRLAGAAGLALPWLLAGVSASAQVLTGSIEGRVADPSGGVIVGAEVTLTHSATNAVHGAITNESGRFRVSKLRPHQQHGQQPAVDAVCAEAQLLSRRHWFPFPLAGHICDNTRHKRFAIDAD